jgi:glycosyltransferase
MSGTSRPQLSIVTACFNSATTIADTIRSVKAQAGVEIEHIIVDGGSHDATLAVVQACGHDGPLISEPDQGIYDAMNKGLRAARGEYVGFLNSDDYLAGPQSISRLLGVATGVSADAVWGNTMQVRADGYPVRLVSGAWAGRTPKNPFLVPPHPSFYARTDLLRSVGGFSTAYRVASDFDLLLRLFALPSFKGIFIGELTTIMRIGGVSSGGVSSVLTNRCELMRVMADRKKSVSQFDLVQRYVVRGVETASGKLSGLMGKRYPPPERPAGVVGA